MSNCKTCRFWVTHYKYEVGYSHGLGRCDAAAMFFDATEWNKELSPPRVFKKEYENTKAFVQDASDYMAYLLTRPDFGCVSYEQREGEK